VVFPDHFEHARSWGSRARIERAVHDLEPGVTELHVQPAIDSPEVRALTSDWRAWVDDRELVMGTALGELLAVAGAHLIGYRDLRALMS
jgi:hypothetical protein